MKNIYQKYKKTCIALIVLVSLTLFYTLFGFFGVPWLITSVVPWILEDKNATLIVREAKFNPYKFELNITGASLETYAPIVKFDELDVGLNFKEIFSKNINIAVVRIKEPYVNIQREQNLSFNFDSLVVSEKSEPENPQNDDGESFFNVTLDKFKLINGDVRFSDASLSRPFEVTLRDLSYEIEGIDLKRHTIGKHLLDTGSNLMEEFDWKGGVSLKPLKIYGDVRFSGLKMDKIWQSYMSELDLNVTHGLLDTRLHYELSIDESGAHVNLHDTSLAAREFRITDKNSSIAFAQLGLEGINLGGNFSGKNEINLGLNALVLEGFKFNDILLQNAKISGTSLALTSGEKLNLNGEVTGIKIAQIEQNATAHAKLEAVELGAIKYELNDKFSAELASLMAHKFSLNDAQNALSLASLELGSTRANFDLTRSVLDLFAPRLALGKFELKSGANTGTLESFEVEDTAIKFDLNASEFDATLPEINLHKFSFKNSEMSVQNELFYIREVQAQARSNFADINASSANFGLEGVKFSGFDIDAASAKFDFTQLGAQAKSENNQTQLSLNLGGLKSANIDINALKQKFITLAGLAASELKFDGKQAELKSFTVGKTSVFSQGKDFAGFDGIALNEAKFNTASSLLALKEIKVNAPFFNDEISKQGAAAVNNLALLKANPSKKSSPKKAAKSDTNATKFIANVENIELINAKSNITQSFLGESMKHEIALKTAKITGFSSDFSKPFELNFKVQTGEQLSLEAKGKVALEPLKAELDAKFNASDLTKLNKIVQKYINGKIASGQIALATKLRLDKGVRANSNFVLSNFGLDDANGTRVAGVNALNIKEIALTDKSVALKNISVNEPFIKAHLFADRRLNLAMLAKSEGNETKLPDEKKTERISENKTAKKADKSEFATSLSGVEIKNASVDFSDESLVLPFLFSIKNLNANIDQIASGTITKLSSQGTIGSGGSANIEIRTDAFEPKKFSDIQLKFKDVELNEVTPYSATFVGRRIDSGLLDLALVYTLKDHKLDGKNDVRIDTIKLGESVESKEAMSLPLQLAISILQDSNNVISLNLPVSGDLDNPEFSYGGIIVKAILQIFTDVVTSPFRLMGNVLGISNAQELAGVDFTAGNDELPQSQDKKIANFKDITNTKKDVVFVINPAYDEAADTLALQKRALDREVAQMAKARDMSEFEALKELALARLKNPSKEPYDELVKLQKIKPAQLEDLANKRAQNLNEAMIKAGVPSDQIKLANKIQKVEAKMDTYVALPMGIETKK